MKKILSILLLISSFTYGQTLLKLKAIETATSGANQTVITNTAGVLTYTPLSSIQTSTSGLLPNTASITINGTAQSLSVSPEFIIQPTINDILGNGNSATGKDMIFINTIYETTVMQVASSPGGYRIYFTHPVTGEILNQVGFDGLNIKQSDKVTELFNVDRATDTVTIKGNAKINGNACFYNSGISVNSIPYINSSNVLKSVTLGSGLSLTNGTLSATGTASTTTVTSGTNITVSGSAPNYTISAASPTLVAGSNVSVTTSGLNYTVAATTQTTGLASLTSPSFTNATLTGTTTLTGVINGTISTNAASSSTVDLSTWTGNYGHITGTTTINSFGTSQAGAQRVITFDGALTITYNATSMKLPANANITTTAGDVATFISEGGGNWKCTNYLRNDISYKAATLATTVYKLGSIITQTATSSITISGLTIPLEANSEYLIEGYLVMDCSSTGGQKVGVTVPTGATFNAWILGRSNSLTAFSEQALNTSGTVTTAMQTFTNGGIQVKFNAWVTTTGTAGNFSIQLQAGVAGQSTKMYPGSMLKLSKI